MSAESIHSSRWAVSDTSSFSGSSLRFPFANGDGLKRVARRQRSRNLTGTRHHRASQNRRGMEEFIGQLPIDPSPKFLGWALPRVMGGGSETAPAFGVAPSTFYLLCDRGSATTTAFGDCYKYGPCMIDTLEITCRSGITTASIDVVALDGTRGETFDGAALGVTRAETPYHYADWVLNADVFNWNLLDFTLRIQNNVSVRYNTGSRVPQAHIIGDRVCTFTARASLDVADYADTYADGDPEITSGTLTGSNGTVSTAFSFANMMIDGEHITGGDGEFIWPITASLAAVAGDEFTVVNDVTP